MSEVKYYDDHFCKCGCGGKIVMKSWYKCKSRIPNYLPGHGNRGKSSDFNLNKIIYCAVCGTQLIIRPRHKYEGYPKYCKGHSLKSAETRWELGKGNRGKKVTLETLQNMRIAHLGDKCNWFGKPGTRLGTHCSEETRQKLSKANSGENHPNFGTHHSGMSGKHHSKEAKQILREACRGEKNCNWHGGKSFEPYSEKFNETLKSEIRDRDSHRCQVCGVPEIECNTNLSIHHIDYNKKNSSEVNLISLCTSCHLKTNFNRKYWKEYFTKLMISKIPSFKKKG